MFLIVPVHPTRHLFESLMFILKPGVEDPDTFPVVHEVVSLGVLDEHDLSPGTEALLIDLPYHIPLALVRGRSGIPVKPEDTHPMFTK